MTRGQLAQISPALSAHATCKSLLSSSSLPCSSTPPPSTSSHEAASPARLPQSVATVPVSAPHGAIASGSSSVGPAFSSQAPSSFRVLYLFAGTARNNGIAAAMHTMMRDSAVRVTVDEIDLCRGSHHDLLNPLVWSEVESALKQGYTTW